MTLTGYFFLLIWYESIPGYLIAILTKSWGQKCVEWKQVSCILNTLNTGGPCNLIAYSQPLGLSLHQVFWIILNFKKCIAIVCQYLIVKLNQRKKSSLPSDLGHWVIMDCIIQSDYFISRHSWITPKNLKSNFG